MPSCLSATRYTAHCPFSSPKAVENSRHSLKVTNLYFFCEGFSIRSRNELGVLSASKGFLILHYYTFASSFFTPTFFIDAMNIRTSVTFWPYFPSYAHGHVLRHVERFYNGSSRFSRQARFHSISAAWTRHLRTSGPLRRGFGDDSLSAVIRCHPETRSSATSRKEMRGMDWAGTPTDSDTGCCCCP